MTETTPEQPRETTAAAEPAKQQDGDKTHRRGGRPFRIAAFVVALAGIVFIIAVIFWSGFILGASEGGEGGHHHGHGEGGSGQEGSSQEERDGSKRDNGMTPYGVVIEQSVPSAGFAG
ncbi:SdpI family protein [Mycolicibacterium moriokaense]|nr:SdpI family protein [Mycolicibacterium moriokaense]